MTCMISYLSRCLCYVLILLMTIELAGCCGYKKIKNKKNPNDSIADSLKKSNKKPGRNTSVTISNEFNDDIDIDLTGELPLRAKDEKSRDLYEKLDYANKLYKQRNYESALREIDRILPTIENDPYLEMQVWTLSAVISDKSDKPRRKKRSYTKMMEARDKLLKDVRYKKAYEDGMICADFIASATMIGDKKYDFE